MSRVSSWAMMLIFELPDQIRWMSRRASTIIKKFVEQKDEEHKRLKVSLLWGQSRNCENAKCVMFMVVFMSDFQLFAR